MSISFSGLSSGIDTSSWIESLVALRQAKVTKLEEDKEKIVMSQDVLSSIKNFFASFRSVIEKVTDAKFGIMSMDLFAQNLATSSNVSVLTGSATHEGEEATYNVQVDKLATSTEAASNRNYITTVIETQTATLGTKLGELGVQSGQIGVNVGGNNFKLSVSEDDTIGIFIDKLRSVGVDANFNERTGVFTANIDANDINDTLTVQSNGKVGTGIIEAFHLSDSVGGYESGNLETSETDTIVTTATGDTKLSTLGVNAGAVTIEANGAEYTFNITNNSTIDEFVNAMKGVGIDASFKDGLLRIIDAEITGDSGTNLIKALGLETKTNQNTQGSDGLSYSEVKTASGGDRIGDFISEANGAVNVYDKNGNLVGSVTVKDNTTFDDLFDGLSQYGITGRIKDGVVSFSSTDGNYVTGGLMDKLGVGVTTTTVTQTSGAGVSSGGQVTYDTVTGETTTTYQTTTNTTTSTSTAGSGMSSGGQVVYDSVTGETTTIYNTTTSTTTSTSTIGSGMSGGQVVYDSVTGETTTIYNTTTSTTTGTKTSGTGATSDTTIDYETVFAEETVTTYETVITTTTLTTVTAGGDSGSIIEAVVEYTTIKPISTTTIVTTIGTVTTTTTTTVTQSAGTRGFMDSIVRVDTSRLTALSAVNTSGGASITSGTYSISTKDELKKLAELTNAGKIGENVTFVLAADIDLGGEQWTPIGISSGDSCTPFRGTFDGNGYVISNFKVAGFAAGLFGVASGVIKNLGVENFVANVEYSSGVYCGVGGIVGFYEDGGNKTENLTNCYAKGSINSSYSYNTYSGGLIGVIGRSDYSWDDEGNTYYYLASYGSSFLISNSYAEVSSSGICSGGLIGYAFGGNNNIKINNSYAKSTFTKGGAGLVYKATGTNISNSYAEVNISNKNDTNSLISAGLVGDFMNGKISNSYAKGTLSFDSNRSSSNNGTYFLMGGLVGAANYISITGSTADVGISLNDSCSNPYTLLNPVRAGGLVGQAVSTTITSSASKGNITAVHGGSGLLSDSCIGGLVGYAQTLNVSKTSSSGSVTVTQCSGYSGNRAIKLYISNGIGRMLDANMSDVVISGGLSINTTKCDGSNIYAGGAVGFSAGGGGNTITNVAMSGDINVSAKGTISVGGTVGYIYSVGVQIVSVCATGTVVSNGYTGGLIGQVDNLYNRVVSIKNSYTSGDVTGGGYAGGLVGRVNTSGLSVDNAYSSGVISSSNSGITGGLIGQVYGDYSCVVTNSYVLGESPNLTGIFVGNGSSTTSLSTVFYTPYYTSATPYIGNGLGSISDALNITATPFTHNFTAQGGSSLIHTDASSEIFEIESVNVDFSTVYTTTTITDIKTETMKITATISTTNTEPPLVYTTLSGQFIEQITRIDTVNLTALSEVNMNRDLADGTYAIKTTEDLKLINKYKDLGFLTGTYTFVLGADLDLLAQSWTPINFNGTFDGNGYEISNLTINNTTGGNIGLFGTVGGTIKNLGVKNVNIIVNSSNYASVGAIAGQATDIQNCYVTGVGAVKVTCSNKTSTSYVGGLVGSVNNISYSYANINIEANDTRTSGVDNSYTSHIAALAGYLYYNAKYCYATGNINISAANTNNVKVGLVGYTFSAGISHCYVTSDVTGYSGSMALYDGMGGGAFVQYSYYKNGDSYKYMGASGSYSTMSSAPFDLDQKESIIDVRAEYKVLSSRTITSSGTGPIVTTHIDTKTETITEVRTVPVTKSVAMTSGTTFEQIGMTTAGTIKGKTASGKDFTITITSADTVGDIVSVLKDYGINTSVRGGRIYINESDDAYLTSISENVKNALGITKLDNAMYTVVTQTTITTTTTPVESSNTVTTQVQMTGDTLFSQIGLTSDGTFTGVVNGRAFTMTVTSTDTVGDIVNELEDYGFNASVRGGKFYVDGSEGIYLTGISNNLKTALGITSELGAGNSYTVVTHTQTTTTTTAIESTNTVTTQVQMTGDTLFSQIGLTSDGTFTGVVNGRAFTMTVTSTDTVGDIVNELEDYGFNASVRGGKFYVDGSEGIYLTGISNNLKTALGITSDLGAGNSYTVTTHTTITTTTTPNETTTPVTTKIQMTGDTLFSQLGMSSDGTIKGVHNGKAFTIAVTGSDSVGDIVDALSQYGITASVRGGKIYINSSDDAYITEFSDGVKSALGLTASAGSTYTVTTIKTYGNTSATNGELKTINVTSAVSRDTALSELGVTTGEFNIWKDGVKYTALISSDETVGSFMDTLAKFGIEASIINNGNTSTIRVIGNGDAYVAKSSSINNASNVVDVLLPSGNNNTTYNYNGQLQTYNTVTTRKTATEDTLLSEFDTPWGDTMLKNSGILSLEIDGESKNVTITEQDTFGSLIEKLENAGAEAALVGGKFYISSANNVSINTAASTSAIVNPNARINLVKSNSLNNFTASDSPVVEYHTIIEEHTGSAASFANLDTKLSLMNISSGTISIYKNGVKATININSDWTFGDLKSAISARFSDVDLSFEEGFLTLTCADKNAEIDFGSTTDTSNLLAITGLKKDASDRSKVQSARALYNANADSVITEAGLFKNGDVTEGTFVIGEQTITIDSDTTIYDVISQINSSETSNATAWWDSINAQLIIKSRSTGAALINIEAGTSNFTDILGLTDSEWNADGSLKSTKLKVDSQKLGTNAEFRINGTAFTSTSNTINSDVSRIKGVTLELKGVSEGSTVTLTVERDRESLANALSDVVDAYNELMTNVDKEIAIGGTLHDQSMLRLLRNRLQSMMTSSSAGAEVFKNLNQIGICTKNAIAGNISTDRINALNFDKDKFFEVLKADEKAVKSLLVGSSTNSGIFVQVEDLLENALRSVTGYFDSTANSMKNKENQIERKIAKGNEAIEKYRAKLENKFNAMDMLIGKMQQQYTSFLGV